MKAHESKEENKHSNKDKQMALGRKKFNMDPKKGRHTTAKLPAASGLPGWFGRRLGRSDSFLLAFLCLHCWKLSFERERRNRWSGVTCFGRQLEKHSEELVEAVVYAKRAGSSSYRWKALSVCHHAVMRCINCNCILNASFSNLLASTSAPGCTRHLADD